MPGAGESKKGKIAHLEPFRLAETWPVPPERVALPVRRKPACSLGSRTRHKSTSCPLNILLATATLSF